MSKTVDKKIVELGMDNSDLVSKAAQSTKALGGLQEGINKVKGRDLSSVSSGLRGIGSSAGEAASKSNLLSEAADTIKNRFSSMGIATMTVITNLTNRVVNAGMQLAQSFTTAPIKAGFDMYENKLKSIQVILSNTQGKSNLKDVQNALSSLNDYANKTVYSFQDMTTNMGTFTAAGVDLNTAKDAIQGIGNLAAASGSSTEQAGTAMYQLSQAIASGSVKLQDWNSVVNAGMGGTKFQDALKKNGVEMGKNIKMTDNFRESLQNGWLTTDVLMKTLRQFKDDKSMEQAATQSKTFSDAMDQANDALKSGWATTWEKLLGDYSQAPKLWTAFASAVTGAIDATAKSRNDLIQGFNDLGGRAEVLNLLVNTFHLVANAIDEVKKGFKDVFPSVTAKQLYSFVTGLNIFVAKAMGATDAIDALRGVSRGFFTIIKLGAEVVVGFAKVLGAMIPDNLISDIIKILGSIGNFIYQMGKGNIGAKDFSNGLDNLHTAVNNFYDGIEKAFKSLGGFLGIIEKIGQAIAKWITPYFKIAAKAISDFVGSFTFGDLLGAGGVGGLILIGSKLSGVKKIFSDFFDKITGFIDKGADTAKSLDILKDSLKGLTTAFKATTLIEIAAAVSILAISMKMLSGLSLPQIGKGLESIGVAMFALTKTLEAISKFDFSTGAFKAAALMIALSVSIVELAKATTKLSQIDPDKLASGLIGLAVTIGILVKGMNSLTGFVPVAKGASIGVIALAGATIILVDAVDKLSKIKGTSLIKAVMSLGIIFSEIGMYARIVNGVHINPSTSIGILALAASTELLIQAISKLAKINSTSLSKALLSTGIIFGEIALFTLAVNRVKISPTTIVTMLALSETTKMLVSSISKMATINATSLGKALLALGVIFGEIVAFSAGMSGMKLGTTGPQILILAIAIQKLVIPIQKFGQMSLNQIGKGLTTLGLALAIIVAAMAGSAGALAGAASIMITAVAINALVGPLKALGSMSLMQIGTALLALAGAFTIMAVASHLIGVSGAVGLLAFAAAMGAVGLAVMGIGIAATAFVGFLSLMSTMSANTLDHISKSFNTLLKNFGNSIPLLTAVVVKAILAFLNALNEIIPKFVDVGINILMSLLRGIEENIYEIVTLSLKIIAQFIEGLAEGLPKVLKAGTDFIIAFIDGLANNIRKNGPRLLQAIGSLIEAILEIMVKGLIGVLDTLLGWIPGAHDMLKNAGDSAVKGLREGFHVKGIGEDGGQEFVDGISSKQQDAYDAGVVLKQHAEDGTAEGTDSQGNTSVMYNNGQQAGAQYGLGVQSGKPGAQTHGQELANGVQTGADNPDAMKTTGAGVSGAYNYGLKSNAPGAFSAGNQLANNAHTGSKTDLSGNGANGGATFNGGLGGQAGGAGAAGNLLKNNAHASTQVDLSGNGAAGGSSFNGGLSNQAGGAGNAGHHVAHTAKEHMKVDTTSTGKYAGQGFIDGLGSKVGDAIDAAVKFGKAAAHWLAKSIHVASPSRVTMQTGVYFGQGFINGINGTANDAETAATSLGQQSVTALKSVGNQINDLMNDSLNLQPHITPVLDLSNINATPINLTASITSARMLGSDPSVAATQVTNNITFGDFKFDVQAKDTATAQELVDMIHSKFQGWLAQEVRKVKEVR